MSSGVPTAATGTRTIMRRAKTGAYAIGLAGSLSVLLFLNIADLHAQWEAQRHISQMQDICREEGDEKRLASLGQAQRYNERLAGNDPSGEIAPYEKQLLYKKDPMISFIEIPKISVKLPIYHGVEENALMAGVGHWEGSSLPVGGDNTHCVLMGHSGMRNTRMFDDVGKLAFGDKLVIWTLNEPYCYEVTETETLLPEDAAKRFVIQPGQDLVTLVTCRPIGANTHRLLVHATRCAYHPEEAGEVGIDAYVNDRNAPLIIAMILLLFAVVATSMRKASRHGNSSLREKAQVERNGSPNQETTRATIRATHHLGSPHRLRSLGNRHAQRDGPPVAR
ncbi:MAG: class C sortase [Coriobacteriia bacterium]|nr:class C sortase [Coriobacteriia bacterium]